MRQSCIECDGCRREVHDDLVEIVGDRVLCPACRKRIPPGSRRRDGDLAPAEERR